MTTIQCLCGLEWFYPKHLPIKWQILTSPATTRPAQLNPKTSIPEK
ncbi:MAG: hypothetical protein FWB80_09135 [Defluviitaleaceae bacterium]|nr:hypothetical protein [Defluviitaleaceae bacterium]